MALDLNILTVEEAATRAGVHRQTITRAADTGQLPEIRTSGHLRYRLYFAHHVDEWAATRQPSFAQQAATRLRERQAAEARNTHEPHHEPTQHPH